MALESSDARRRVHQMESIGVESHPSSEVNSNTIRFDRRLLQRVPVNLLVGVVQPDGSLHTGEVTEVGLPESDSPESGIRLLISLPLEPHTSVSCRLLDAPGNPRTEFQFAVKWCQRLDDGRYAAGGTIIDAGGSAL